MTDGIENFEVTDWDIQNEFNPDRVRHQLTKKQQIYGVFASDSDDDIDERPGLGAKNSFSSHINFISGGVRKVDEKDETKKASDEEAGSSGEEAPSRPVKNQRSSYNQRSGFGNARRPNQMAGFRSSARETSNDFGEWEKYTKGIGKKLMLQMGFKEGKGLGKTLQGITTPIEAKPRKGKGAIGLYGPESGGMQRVRDNSSLSTIEEKSQEKIPHQRQWKKKAGEKPSVKYVYKTADEVMEEDKHSKYHGVSSHLSSVKVIDMTGPEQRVLSGYHQIGQQHSKPPEQEVEIPESKKTSVGYHFSLPELEHNLKLLEDSERKKIVRCNQEKRFTRDRLAGLKQEEDRLVQVLIQEEKQIKTLEKVLNIVESLVDKSRSEESNATLELAARTLKDLQEEFRDEYILFNLSDLAITIVGPLVKKLLENWNPLMQYHHCIDIFKDWKDLMDSGRNTVSWNKGNSHEMDPYTHLVWDVWMPPVRRAILGWNVRQWEPMLNLLTTWMPLIPPWIITNILEQHIFPRLQADVENWNPLTDTVPVHSWLHPWIPLMGQLLEPLYSPLRQKLSAALMNWHPSDCSAKLILEPWRNVFSQGVMDAFIMQNIVPKLVMALQNYIINPHQQHLDAWTWVMSWSDMIPEPCMVNILEKNFFPKWLQVLYTWLTHNPNYEEVTKWYTGWKSMLPPNLYANPVIKEQFKLALDAMNRAVTCPQGLLGTQPGAKENMAYLTNVERQQELDRHVKPRREYDAIIQSVRGTTKDTLSMKDLIEKRAQESNVLFMPVHGRFQEGKQVHRFGGSLMYIDRVTIFVFNEKTWVPTSLQSLLDMAG